MNKKTMTVMEVSEKMLSSLRIWRERDGGFQRTLDHDRAIRMAEDFSGGGVAPPIVVAKIEGGLFVVDGQHRVEARRLEKFPLFAAVVECTKEQAAHVFIDLNTKGIRISVEHRIKVDPGEVGRGLRAVSESTGVDVRLVHGAMRGIAHQGYLKQNSLQAAVFQRAEMFLKEWQSDRRWNLDGGIYKKPLTLEVVGGLLKGRDDWRDILRRIKDLDFSNEGALKRRFPSSKLMREYILLSMYKEKI